jgi:hypothetical protein
VIFKKCSYFERDIMPEASDENIIISKETWYELAKEEYFREVLEAIEDREALRNAKSEDPDFEDFRDYDKKRKSKSDV